MEGSREGGRGREGERERVREGERRDREENIYNTSSLMAMDIVT